MKLKLFIVTIFVIHIFIPLCEFYANVIATNNFFAIAFWVCLSFYDFWELGNLIGWIKDKITRTPRT